MKNRFLGGMYTVALGIMTALLVMPNRFYWH
jgi:hypothetical protein